MKLSNDLKKYYEDGRRKLLKIIANDDYTLDLYYDDSIRKYDMSNELYGAFEILKNINKFKEVFIDEDGNIAWEKDSKIDSNIVWNNKIDICSDSAYLNSKKIK